MEQVAKYRGELEWGEIPMAGKTVEAASLLPEGFRPGNVAAVIVRHGARSYAVCLRARVPATAEIVLDGSGQVCGIPAVAGGAPGAGGLIANSPEVEKIAGRREDVDIEILGLRTRRRALNDQAAAIKYSVHSLEEIREMWDAGDDGERYAMTEFCGSLEDELQDNDYSMEGGWSQPEMLHQFLNSKWDQYEHVKTSDVFAPYCRGGPVRDGSGKTVEKLVSEIREIGSALHDLKARRIELNDRAARLQYSGKTLAEIREAWNSSTAHDRTNMVEFCNSLRDELEDHDFSAEGGYTQDEMERDLLDSDWDQYEHVKTSDVFAPYCRGK